MGVYNVMERHVIQNELLILGYKPTYNYTTAIVSCCTLYTLVHCSARQQETGLLPCGGIVDL